MATNSDAEKLRKQIEVLSSLIQTQRELKKNDNSTNKQQSSVKYSWKKKTSSQNKNESESLSRNELSHEVKCRNSSNSFTSDRRKVGNTGEFREKSSDLHPLPRTAATTTYKNNNFYKKNEEVVPLSKHSLSSNNQASKPVLANVEKGTQNSRILNRNGDKTKEKNVSDMPYHEASKFKDVKNLAASKSLLSARLSSLSSSIAAAKSKLNLESSVVSDTGLKNLTKLTSTTSNSSSKVIKSLSSLVNTKGKTSQASSTVSSSYSWSKLQSSNPGTFTNLNKPSTSSLKWTKLGTCKDQSTLQKTLNTVRKSNKPSHGSTNVWRSQQSIKLDRRKRKSITLESKGFMKRRQRVVLKDVPKKVVHISRYSLVNAKRKNPIKAEKSNKVVLIEGIPYKSSANKLQKTSQEKTGTNPKKVKKRSSMTLNIRGEKFLMDVSGKTLTRINPGKTPTGRGMETSRNVALYSEGSQGKHAKRRSSVHKVSIGGVMFVQTAPGVLVRSNDAVNKKIASRVVRKRVHNAILYKYKKNVKTKPKSQQYCMFYNRFGKCNKGENCSYIHDPNKIAVCTKFLQGKCKKTDGTCSFSHKIDKDKMPVCQFFLQGNCTNDDCPYSHVNVSSKAAVCQDFIKGYCLNGQQCKKKHILDCEEFSCTGKCSKGKKCNLLHRERKAKKRRRKSSASKEPKPKRASLEKMTEEDGFLPLEQVDVSTDKDSIHLDGATNKPPAEPIAIKPRFLINKDK